MLWFYRLLFPIALLLASPHYLRRMLMRGGYRNQFANRFGSMGEVPRKTADCKRIWLQAVSVGEIKAIEALVKRLQSSYRVEFCITTTTSTGRTVLENSLSDAAVWRGFFPIDFLPFVRRAWEQLDPDAILLMESELWPEHLATARNRKIPAVLMNARLSDRSYRRHQQLRSLVRPLVCHLTAIATSSSSDTHRFQSLEWIPAEKIRETGNLKLDLPANLIPAGTERARLLQDLGFIQNAEEADAVNILLGASTWPGEELALLRAFETLQAEFPEWRLLIVPRHAERRKELKAALGDNGFSPPFLSAERPVRQITRTLIADTTGELRQFTAISQLAFIGKSLPPHIGGQTPIEAASFGIPLVFGSEMSNFRDISRELLSVGAAQSVGLPDELPAALRPLLRDPSERQRRGRLAASIMERHRGALERTIDLLADLLRLQKR